MSRIFISIFFQKFWCLVEKVDLNADDTERNGPLFMDDLVPSD